MMSPALRLGVDELAERIAVLRHVDRQRQLGRVDRRVGERAFDPERARREGQPLGANLGAERHALGRAREPESDMNDIVAGRHGQGRLGETRIRRSGDASRPDRPRAPNTRQRRPPVSGRAAAVEDRGKAERRLGGVRSPAFAALARRDQRQQRDQGRQNSPSRCQSASRRRKSAPTVSSRT